MHSGVMAGEPSTSGKCSLSETSTAPCSCRRPNRRHRSKTQLGVHRRSFAQAGCECDEAWPLEEVNKLIHLRRCDPQVVPRGIDRSFDSFRVARMQLAQEIVRVACDNTVSGQARLWEDSDIESQQDRGLVS